MKKVVVGTLFLLVAYAFVGNNTALAAADHFFTKNLTVGNTGSEVTQLQLFLEKEGYMVMPKGIKRGRFGAVTRTALIKYQKQNSITPAKGYFGAKTRAVINAPKVTVVYVPPITSTYENSIGTTSNCGPGARFNSATGLPCGTGMTSAPITTAAGTVNCGDGSELDGISLNNFAALNKSPSLSCFGKNIIANCTSAQIKGGDDTVTNTMINGSCYLNVVNRGQNKDTRCKISDITSSKAYAESESELMKTLGVSSLTQAPGAYAFMLMFMTTLEGISAPNPASDLQCSVTSLTAPAPTQPNDVPHGFINKRSSARLKAAWKNKSLLVTYTPFEQQHFQKYTCWDFNNFDTATRVYRVGTDGVKKLVNPYNEYLDLEEYINTDSPAIAPGNYVLSFVSIGNTLQTDFKSVINGDEARFTDNTGRVFEIKPSGYCANTL